MQYNIHKSLTYTLNAFGYKLAITARNVFEVVIAECSRAQFAIADLTQTRGAYQFTKRNIHHRPIRTKNKPLKHLTTHTHTPTYQGLLSQRARALANHFRPAIRRPSSSYIELYIAPIRLRVHFCFWCMYQPLWHNWKSHTKWVCQHHRTQRTLPYNIGNRARCSLIWYLMLEMTLTVSRRTAPQNIPSASSEPLARIFIFIYRTMNVLFDMVTNYIHPTIYTFSPDNDRISSATSTYTRTYRKIQFAEFSWRGSIVFNVFLWLWLIANNYIADYTHWGSTKKHYR